MVVFPLIIILVFCGYTPNKFNECLLKRDPLEAKGLTLPTIIFEWFLLLAFGGIIKLIGSVGVALFRTLLLHIRVIMYPTKDSFPRYLATPQKAQMVTSSEKRRLQSIVSGSVDQWSSRLPLYCFL